MNYFKYILFLCVSIILGGCNKSDAYQDDEEKNGCRISCYKMTKYIQYDEDGKELNKILYLYDSKGREVGYKQYYNNKLIAEMSDYHYDGLNRTFNYIDYINDTKKISLIKETSYNECFIKIQMHIQYDDNNKEQYKYVYSYDSKGREIGFKQYSNGQLTTENLNYQYDDLKLVYEMHNYSNNSETIVRVEKTFLDNSFVKYKSILYLPKNGTENRLKYIYDSEGKPIEYENYYNGYLTTKYTNYKYDGLNSTYDYCEYVENVLIRKCKVNVSYLY